MSSTQPASIIPTTQADGGGEDDLEWYEDPILLYGAVGVFACVLLLMIIAWRCSRRQPRQHGLSTIHPHTLSMLQPPTEPNRTPSARTEMMWKSSPFGRAQVTPPPLPPPNGTALTGTYAAPLSIEEEGLRLENGALYQEPATTTDATGYSRSAANITVYQEPASSYEYSDRQGISLDGSLQGRQNATTTVKADQRESPSSPLSTNTVWIREEDLDGEQPPIPPPRSSTGDLAPPLPPPRSSGEFANATGDDAAGAAVATWKPSSSPNVQKRALPPPPLTEERKAQMQQNLQRMQLEKKKQTLLSQAFSANQAIEREKKKQTLVAQAMDINQALEAERAAADQIRAESKAAEHEKRKKQLEEQRLRLVNQAINANQMARDRSKTTAMQRKAAREQLAREAQQKELQRRSVLDGYPVPSASSSSPSLSPAALPLQRNRGGSKRSSKKLSKSHMEAQKQDLLKQAYAEANKAAERARLSRSESVKSRGTAIVTDEDETGIYDNSNILLSDSFKLSKGAASSAAWTNGELKKLAAEIKKKGSSDSVGAQITFGYLMKSSNLFQNLPGLLVTAKNHQVVAFSPGSLWPGRDDDEVITLEINEDEIDIAKGFQK